MLSGGRLRSKPAAARPRGVVLLLDAGFPPAGFLGSSVLRLGAGFARSSARSCRSISVISARVRASSASICASNSCSLITFDVQNPLDLRRLRAQFCLLRLFSIKRLPNPFRLILFPPPGCDLPAVFTSDGGETVEPLQEVVEVGSPEDQDQRRGLRQLVDYAQALTVHRCLRSASFARCSSCCASRSRIWTSILSSFVWIAFQTQLWPRSTRPRTRFRASQVPTPLLVWSCRSSASFCSRCC